MTALRRLSSAVLALAAASAAGCATTPSEPLEPPVRVVTVKEQTPVPCPALLKLGPEPEYPDTDAAILAAPNIAERSRLYTEGRVLRIARLAEYVAVKAGCIF